MKVVFKLFVIVIFLSMNMTQSSFVSANDNWPKIKGSVAPVDDERSAVTVKNAKNQQTAFQVVPTSEIKKHGLRKLGRNAVCKDLNTAKCGALTYSSASEKNVARDIDIFSNTTARNVPPLMLLYLWRRLKLHHIENRCLNRS